MYHVPEAAVPVIAADSSALVKATDGALQAHVQLFASVIEASRASNLPMNLSQGLFARFAAHGEVLLRGRADLQKIIARLNAIQQVTDQAETASGCPDGLPEEIGEAFFGDSNSTGKLSAAAAQNDTETASV